jgi:hypothetical protein
MWQYTHYNISAATLQELRFKLTASIEAVPTPPLTCCGLPVHLWAVVHQQHMPAPAACMVQHSLQVSQSCGTAVGAAGTTAAATTCRCCKVCARATCGNTQAAAGMQWLQQQHPNLCSLSPPCL